MFDNFENDNIISTYNDVFTSGIIIIDNNLLTFIKLRHSKLILGNNQKML